MISQVDCKSRTVGNPARGLRPGAHVACCFRGAAASAAVRAWTGPLRTLFGCLQFLFLVLGGLVLAAFMALARRRRPDLSARSPLDFLCGSERLLLSRTHPGSPGSLTRPSAIGLAEVCRNRTDRSTIGRPAGFEVPDGHQPACTSAIIITYCAPEFYSVIRGGKKKPSAISYQPSVTTLGCSCRRLKARVFDRRLVSARMGVCPGKVWRESESL